MKYTIGIDLGGTTMTAGLVDEAYNIVGKITRPTRLPRPAQDLEQALADLCRAVAKDCKIDFADVSYVGIGTPGSVNFTTGFVGYNTNFGYYDWNLGPDLEALLGCKVYVENDANAAAFGEYIAGGAKGFKDAVVITLGRSPRLRRSSRSGRSTSSKGWDKPNSGTRTDSRNERVLCVKLARASDSAVACESSRCRAMLSVARRRRLGRHVQSREPSPLASERIREKPSLPSRRAKP